MPEWLRSSEEKLAPIRAALGTPRPKRENGLTLTRTSEISRKCDLALLQLVMDVTKELARLERLVNSPDLIRFAKDTAAAAEAVNTMIAPSLKALQGAEEFVREVEKASARFAEWQQRQEQQRLLLSFPHDSQVKKRTIVRPEVTRQIGFR